MFDADPKEFSLLGEESFERGGALIAHRNAIALLQMWVGTSVSGAVLKEACDKIREMTGIVLKYDQLEAILVFFPLARIKLGRYGAHDPEAWGLALDALAGHMAGTRWPQNREEVDLELFLRNLRVAARFLGYTTVNS